MWPVRFLSPVLAIGVAGWYFLPETTGNILDFVRRYEERVPVIWETHQTISKDMTKLKSEAMKEVEQVSDKLGIAKK
jgi:hypothetical protein